MLWGGDTTHSPSQKLSRTHLRSRFPFMELGGVLRARRAPATGGREAVQGATRGGRRAHSASRRGVRREEGATASPPQPHSAGSGHGEPPSGGGPRPGEWKEKREARGELRAELAWPAAAGAATAPPRLRRRRRHRRPPRGPPPEARWRHFRPRLARRPGLASPSRAVRARPALETRRGRVGRGRRAWAEPGPAPGLCGPFAPRLPPRADWCLPATSRRAPELTWGGAYLDRGLSRGAGPPASPRPSLHAAFGRPPQRAVESPLMNTLEVRRAALTTVLRGGDVV